MDIDANMVRGWFPLVRLRPRRRLWGVLYATTLSVGTGCPLERVTWPRIADDLDQAVAFCDDIGLRDPAEKSRFALYRRRLRDLIGALERGGREAAREIFDADRVTNGVALAESAELATLLPFLKSQKREVIRPKLERALLGPVIPTDEDQNSSRGRNTLFELNLASRLWTAGLDPILGEWPDLTCEVNDRQLLIECKRPVSMGGARKAIGKARDQIIRNLKKSRAGSRGVIAMSLAKIVNPGDKLFRYRGEVEGRKKLAAVLDRQRLELQDSCRVLPDKIMGMIWHIVTIGVDEEISLATLVQETTVSKALFASGRTMPTSCT
jgi:hypothetical protein